MRMWCALVVGMALLVLGIESCLLVPSITRDRPYETDSELDKLENRHDE